MIILGISGLYHDSAAAIVSEKGIIAAAQEERFTRVKHDNSIPVNAIKYCLNTAKINMIDVDYVVYYDNPYLTLDRFVNNAFILGEEAEYVVNSQIENIIGSRLIIDTSLRKLFGRLGKEDKLYVCEHHISHAASAFYPSPFSSSAILTIDGVGEWATTTIGKGNGNSIEILEEIDYPHSIGLLYSAFTAFCGFKVNSGDYKFMGLAPYGEPIYYDLIKEKLIDVKQDGSYRLNLEYFDFYKGKYMTNDKFAELFGGPAREAESVITRREMNIAASAQKLTEEIIILLAKHAKEITGEKNLVIAGGVALNCVANGKLLKTGMFDDIWIQPAAGDAGGALGSALYMMFNNGGIERIVAQGFENDSQEGSYLGPEFDNDAIKEYLDSNKYAYHLLGDDELADSVSELISKKNVIGWFQGRMEYGPRALCNRSIIADSMDPEMQSKLNLKIKYRESFRPFAPVVMREDVSEYFELNCRSPYMLLVSDVNEERRIAFDKEEFLTHYHDDMLPIVNSPRSDIPAVTHIDYSARIQTVSKESNPRFYALLESYKKKSGCSVLINTSFNVRGEPIVCTPDDAYKCFMRTEMDVLVMGNFVLYKTEQPKFDDEQDWRKIYALD